MNLSSGESFPAPLCAQKSPKSSLGGQNRVFKARVQTEWNLGKVEVELVTAGQHVGASYMITSNCVILLSQGALQKGAALRLNTYLNQY